MYISLDSILIDELLYPRNELAWRDVQRYIAAVNIGTEFPPIIVGKRDGRYVLIDGRHRYEAFKRAKKEKIAALLTKLPEDKWFAEAVRLNVIHGHPLSYQEKLKAAMILKRQNFSLEEIEKIVVVQTEQLEQAINKRGAWINPNDVRPVVAKASIAAMAEQRGRVWLENQAKKIESQQGILSGHTFKDLASELIMLLDSDFVTDENLSIVIELQSSIEKWLTVRK